MMTPIAQQIERRLTQLTIKRRRQTAAALPGGPEQVIHRAQLELLSTEAAIGELEWVQNLLLSAQLHEHRFTVPLSPTEWGAITAALDACIERCPGLTELDAIRQKIVNQVELTESGIAEDETETLAAQIKGGDL